MSNTQTQPVPTNPDTLVVDMPESAPPLGFDPAADTFNWREVYPSNFWSMDAVTERKALLGGWPVLTPARIVIKPVYDPSDYEGKSVPEAELKPKIVMEFEEAVPALVFNKSRCELATQLTGTANPALWAERLGAIMLSVGVLKGKAQISFEPAPQTESDIEDITLDEFNDQFFG